MRITHRARVHPLRDGGSVQPNGHQLIDGLLRGDRASLARAISFVENAAPSSMKILDAVYPRTGKAYRIGVTGPPGAGKSTLVSRLVGELWSEGKSIGVVAVDPSSPFTRGALLGDRVRFQEIPDDPRFFVRSMASRGSSGGLAFRTGEVCDLLDASGKDVLVIETVGVGQSELDGAAAVHTTVVVLVPESGDEVQAMKAGLMEIGDVFTVNKADRVGADRMARCVEEMLHLGAGGDGWKAPVVLLSALSGDSFPLFLDALRRHEDHIRKSGDFARLKIERGRAKIEEIVERERNREFWKRSEVECSFEEALAQLAGGKTTPYREAARMLDQFRREGK